MSIVAFGNVGTIEATKQQDSNNNELAVATVFARV